MGIWNYFSNVFVSSFKTPIAITEGALLVFTLVAGILTRYFPQWEDKVKTLLIFIPLGLLVFVFIISLLVSGYQKYNEDHTRQQDEIQSLSTELEVAKAAAIPSVQQIMLQTYFENVDIPIASLSVYLSDSTMRNKTFENCNVIGPAVFALTNNVSIINSSFDGNQDAVFIVTTNRQVWGILALENVTFLQCKFSKVAFIGSQEQIDKIKAGFSFSPK